MPVSPHRDWCAARDLNPHPLKDQFLRLTCLPFHQQRIYKMVGTARFERAISRFRSERDGPDYATSRWSEKLDSNQRSPASKAGGNNQTSLFPEIKWSGLRKSNSLVQFGRLMPNQSAKPAKLKWSSHSESNRVLPLFRRTRRPLTPQLGTGVRSGIQTQPAAFTARYAITTPKAPLKLGGPYGI